MFFVSRYLEQRRAHEKERQLFAFLKAAHTESIPHYQKNLFEHLVNTYGILKDWGCEPHICYAGLFHSIYGTQIFKTQTIPYAERKSIRNLLGEQAERLAYLFSVSDRPEGLMCAIGTGKLLNKITGKEVLLSPDELAELLFIECANLNDQGSLEPFYTNMRRKLNEIHFPDSSLQARLLWQVLSIG